jgi:hypothetical protein
MGITPRSNQVRRLVYVSRSLIYADAAMLDALVQRSSERNMVVGITGMLWFDGHHFAQVLEGELDAVGATIERIAKDRRHTDCAIVVDREVKGRAFGNWGMVQPNDELESLQSTAFLVGLSMVERGQAAKRLYNIVVACEL